MPILRKLICRRSVIRVRIPAGFFAGVDKLILKIHMKTQEHQNNLEKEESWRTSQFQNLLKRTVIKTVL